MNRLTVLEVAAPHCVDQAFDGEIIVINMTSGTYYSIRDMGAVAWRDLAAGHAIETLAALAAGFVGGSQAVMNFAARVTAEGLMRPAANAAVACGEPQIAAALVGSVAPALTFEIFEDMKSLILLDPVHEADEARGWPALPRDA
jgi:hypothetical protein